MNFDPEKPPAAIPLDQMLDMQTAEEAAAETFEFFKRSVQPPPNPWLQSPRRERDPEPSEVLERTFGDWERDLEKRAGSFTNEPDLVLEPRGGRLQTVEQLLRKSTPAPDFLAGQENSGSRFEHGALHKNAGERRKLGILAWLRSQLALGKSADELIEHAETHDLEVANLIRTCAAELEAA